jgi:hypothetical protein
MVMVVVVVRACFVCVRSGPFIINFEDFNFYVLFVGKLVYYFNLFHIHND